MSSRTTMISRIVPNVISSFLKVSRLVTVSRSGAASEKTLAARQCRFPRRAHTSLPTVLQVVPSRRWIGPTTPQGIEIPPHRVNGVHHPGGKPELEAEKVAGGGMQRQRAARMVPVEKERYRCNRDVGQAQRNQHITPPRWIEQGKLHHKILCETAWRPPLTSAVIAMSL